MSSENELDLSMQCFRGFTNASNRANEVLQNALLIGPASTTHAKTI
jgi:hypothetical protein